jgi:hypothetical protein
MTRCSLWSRLRPDLTASFMSRVCLPPGSVPLWLPPLPSKIIELSTWHCPSLPFSLLSFPTRCLHVEYPGPTTSHPSVETTRECLAIAPSCAPLLSCASDCPLSTYIDPALVTRWPSTCISDDNLHGTDPITTTSLFNLSSQGLPPLPCLDPLARL